MQEPAISKTNFEKLITRHDSSVILRMTLSNQQTRRGEHNNPKHNSEPVQHLKNNLNHSFYWFIVVNASKSKRTRKNLVEHNK